MESDFRSRAKRTENSQWFRESLSSVGVQLQTKSCRCCFVCDVCVTTKGEATIVSSLQPSGDVQVREWTCWSLLSRVTPLLHRFSPIFLEKKERFDFSLFFIYCRRTYARQLGWMKRLAASVMVVVLIHTKPISSPWKYVSRFGKGRW